MLSDPGLRIRSLLRTKSYQLRPVFEPLGSGKFVEQILCRLQDRRVEALGEPAVDRREKITRFMSSTLVAPEPGEGCGRTQFPNPGALLAGHTEGTAERGLGFGRVTGVLAMSASALRRCSSGSNHRSPVASTIARASPSTAKASFQSPAFVRSSASKPRKQGR